jgi:asparagine synthetase B (glutamine-hydrolysing)
MCGIFGYLITGSQVGQQSDCFSYRCLWNNLYTLKGRGPDNMQLKKISENLILGFQRLRINDTTAAGDQPLQRGKLSVIANAEIYNY